MTARPSTYVASFVTRVMARFVASALSYFSNHIRPRGIPRGLGMTVLLGIPMGCGIPGYSWSAGPDPLTSVSQSNGSLSNASLPNASLASVAEQTQPKLVKIFGAGRGGLEAYQSGFLISPDGHVLTLWSYVLDPDTVSVVLHDGRRFDGKLIGMDPALELAVLKIEASELDFFELKGTVDAQPGERILAFSNLYAIASGNEATSVMQGRVAAVASLAARRGTFETPYRGRVFVLDAVTNNAGAAGGALTNRAGQLLGILGKELRDSGNDVWLNYALPLDVVSKSVTHILTGNAQNDPTTRPQPVEPVTTQGLGIVLVPRVLPSTPPYVEMVLDQSPAAVAGLQSDDLIVLVGQQSMASREAVIAAIATYDRIDPIQITVLRHVGDRQELHEFTLRVR